MPWWQTLYVRVTNTHLHGFPGALTSGNHGSISLIFPTRVYHLPNSFTIFISGLELGLLDGLLTNFTRCMAKPEVGLKPAPECHYWNTSTSTISGFAGIHVECVCCS